MTMLPPLPDTLETLLREQYGEALTERIITGYKAQRPVTLRVNTLRATAEQVQHQLTDAGITWHTVPWYADALVLDNVREDAVEALPLYSRGEVYLQSLSSMIPPLLMNPQAGETILDMAAAPGGKTTQLAALSGGKALITACEKNAIRADRLRFNLERQGASKVNVMQEDARRLDDFFSFNKILLDAPCSGSGTVQLLAGQPARRMTRDWLNKTVATQTAMLQKALRLLGRGREMVYSTCSILRMENEGVLKKCLKAAGARIVPIEHEMMNHLPLLPTELPGVICVCPDALHEGFFAAKIRKG
ncbi:MAG: RsmB/NOP family class I SAM-dependent RNA methyltransferase [Aristaeellaceae bacterium]